MPDRAYRGASRCSGQELNLDRLPGSRQANPFQVVVQRQFVGCQWLQVQSAFRHERQGRFRRLPGLVPWGPARVKRRFKPSLGRLLPRGCRNVGSEGEAPKVVVNAPVVRLVRTHEVLQPPNHFVRSLGC